MKNNETQIGSIVSTVIVVCLLIVIAGAVEMIK